MLKHCEQFGMHGIKSMNVNINEVFIIVKYQVFQSIKVHHCVCQQSSLKNNMHHLKSNLHLWIQKVPLYFLNTKGAFIFFHNLFN